MLDVNAQIYEFGAFRLDFREKLLFKGQELIPLTPKALDILILLVRNHGVLVGKERLIAEIWPETFVTESSLTHQICQIRKALNGESEGSAYIETIPRRGYRFKPEAKQVARSESAEFTPIDKNTVQDHTLAQAGHAIHFKGSLKYWVFTALVGAVLVASYLWFSRRPKVGFFRPSSAAILPFVPIGNTNHQLGLGMADSLNLKLSNLDQLQILPTSAVSKFIDSNQDPTAIGRELGVDAVIAGTVQEADGRVRVTVQVTNVNTGQPLWQAKFDENETDVFTVQDAISTRIAETFTLQMTGENRKQIAKRYTTNPDAYRFFVLGLYFWSQRTEDSLTKAIENLQRATELDPKYALAYAYAADCYQLQVFYQTMTDERRAECLRKAQELAEKALSIDPTIPEAHLILALVKHHNLDDTGVEDLFKQAISLANNNGTAHLRYGWFLLEYGRIDEAIREVKIGRDLDPLSAINNAYLAVIMIGERRYDEVIKYGRQAIDLDPNIPRARVALATGYIGKKLYSEAIAELQNIDGSQAEQNLALQELAYAYAVSGDQANAWQVLKKLETSPSNIGTTSDTEINMAAIYAALGEQKKAFEWLGRLSTFKGKKNMIAVQLHFDPQLDSLRDDPQFARVLAKHPLPKPH